MELMFTKLYTKRVYLIYFAYFAYSTYYLHILERNLHIYYQHILHIVQIDRNKCLSPGLHCLLPLLLDPPSQGPTIYNHSHRSLIYRRKHRESQPILVAWQRVLSSAKSGVHILYIEIGFTYFAYFAYLFCIFCILSSIHRNNRETCILLHIDLHILLHIVHIEFIFHILQRICIFYIFNCIFYLLLYIFFWHILHIEFTCI